MSWKLRHQGSPRHIEGLSLQALLEGLQDEKWESNSEVMGPGDKRWITLESHPLLEEVVEEIEESKKPLGEPEDPEEQRIDMNPLIDVCLVLLVFFILATTMAVLEKRINVPRNRADSPGAVKQVSPEQVRNFMIMVQAYREGPNAVIKIEDRVVQPGTLVREMEKYVKDTRKTEIVIDAKNVDWSTVVSIIDAAGAAGINKVHFKASSGAGAAPAPPP